MTQIIPTEHITYLRKTAKAQSFVARTIEDMAQGIAYLEKVALHSAQCDIFCVLKDGELLLRGTHEECFTFIHINIPGNTCVDQAIEHGGWKIVPPWAHIKTHETSFFDSSLHTNGSVAYVIEASPPMH